MPAATWGGAGHSRRNDQARANSTSNETEDMIALARNDTGSYV